MLSEAFQRFLEEYNPLGETEARKKISFDDARIMYIRKRRHSRKVKSERTIKFYGEVLNVFRNFLQEEVPDCIDDATLIDEEIILAFIDEMIDDGKADSTIKGRVNTLRVFFRELSIEGLTRNVCRDITFEYSGYENIIPFSNCHIEAMMKVLNNKCLDDLRTKTFVKLFIETGIRLNELYNLNIEDIDFENQRIHVRKGKYDRNRFIPFGSDTKKYLQKYVNAFGIYRGALSDPFFIGKDGKRYGKRRIQEDFMKLRRKANIQGIRCSAHTCRHTFALNFILNGGSTIALRHFMGHKTEEMVARYVRITQEHGDKIFISHFDKLSNGRLENPDDF